MSVAFKTMGISTGHVCLYCTAAYLLFNGDKDSPILQRARDANITSLWRQNDVATSFWRQNDVIIASCARWEYVFESTNHTKWQLQPITEHVPHPTDSPTATGLELHV